jgi:hypothetical protein
VSYTPRILVMITSGERLRQTLPAMVMSTALADNDLPPRFDFPVSFGGVLWGNVKKSPLTL